MPCSLAKEQLNKNVLLAVLAKIAVKQGSVFYELALLAKFVYTYKWTYKKKNNNTFKKIKIQLDNKKLNK